MLRGDYPLSTIHYPALGVNTMALPLPTKHEPPIDVERRARHVAPVIGRQESNDGRHLRSVALSAEERGAAATSTSELPGSEEKADIHQSSAQHEFYERLGECDGRAFGLVIADLLRLSTP